MSCLIESASYKVGVASPFYKEGSKRLSSSLRALAALGSHEMLARVFLPSSPDGPLHDTLC